MTIPFNFTFYDVIYTTIYVGANGNLQFQTAESDSYPDYFGYFGNYDLIPFIAFFYADLLPNAAPASRTYGFLGQAPNRQFIVRYSQVPYNIDPNEYDSPASYPPFNTTLTCDVLLYETSNNIEFRYYAVAQASSDFEVDIGIQAGTLTEYYYNGYEYSYETSDYISVINDEAIATTALVGTSYTFFPLTPFVDAQPLPSYPPPPSNTSNVYTAAVKPVPAPVAFTPAATLPFTDDDVFYVPLGFNFTFYNVTYSSVFVAANGNLQFATSSPTSSTGNLGTSSNSALSPLIAYFFADLLPATAPASRTYATIGTAPNRQWILRYSQVPLQAYTGSGVLSCDVLLSETSNVIEFRYYAVPVFQVSYEYLSIGIQNSVVAKVYDYEAVWNNAILPVYTSVALTNSSYTFTPKVPFTKPTLFKLPGLTPTVTSKFYFANATALPAPLAFTPAGTLPSPTML